MMHETAKDIARWMLEVERLNQSGDTPTEEMNELVDAAKEKPTLLDKHKEQMAKHGDALMDMKVDHLNMEIKRLYLEKDVEFPQEKMFQFRFENKGGHFEFFMPLKVLFGPKTIKECARYWDSFFLKAGIQTSFEDNIKDALDKSNTVMPMKLNKELTKEEG